jgi:hypothetical protein
LILFTEDWHKYPRAIVHNETKNKTWLRLASLLKYMKIENHMFLLALHNPELKDIDPLDNNLDIRTKALIAKECKENPWYYFREVARVPPIAGGEPVQFRANRANIALLWLYFNHITTYLLQPRQTGKSLTIIELIGYLLNTRSNNYNIGLLTKDEKLRDKTSRHIRDTIECLVDYIQILDKRDVKNSEKISVKKLNNNLSIMLSGSSKAAALNVGRGLSLPTSIIDEFAYITNIHLLLPVLLASAGAAREEAAKSGSDYGTIFTTTPGRLNTNEGRFTHNIYKGSLRWSEKFYDLKDQTTLEEVMVKNTSGRGKYNVMLLEFNHRQLGFTDEWLAKRMSDALSEGEDAESDFLLKWVGGSFSSPIDKDILEILKDTSIKNPRVDISTSGYILNWYVSESTLYNMLNNGYVTAGLDTSEAIGNDDTTLVFRYSKTGETIATGVFNETNLIMFANFLLDILNKYDNLVLVPERKSSAGAIIDHIILMMHASNKNPFKRIFNMVYNEKEKYIKQYPELFMSRCPSMEVMNKFKSKIGFATTGAGIFARSELYGNTFNFALKYTANVTRDVMLIEQLSGLTVKNNRIDHSDGSHDDMVISWLLSMWFLQKAKNKDLYVNNADTGLRDIVDNKAMFNNKNVDKKKIQEQESLKEYISNLITLLRNEQNEYIAFKILNKIRKLEDKIDVTLVANNYNIEDTLKEIKIYKKINNTRAA